MFAENSRGLLLDNKNLERVRWRCRRGLLELDIVLGRFVEQHYAELDAGQRVVFDTLLDAPDTVLWDMITGKVEPQEECRTVIGLLNRADN
ncbi:MAG: succinate dehydrogenase assembly factor 2 [Nitrosomonadales bacterium]|nr:succinate dehydrogenase assembly factor 2 [Nitrosomonadales bacterium]